MSANKYSSKFSRQIEAFADLELFSVQQLEQAYKVASFSYFSKNRRRIQKHLNNSISNKIKMKEISEGKLKTYKESTTAHVQLRASNVIQLACKFDQAWSLTTPDVHINNWNI